MLFITTPCILNCCAEFYVKVCDADELGSLHIYDNFEIREISSLQSYDRCYFSSE